MTEGLSPATNAEAPPRKKNASKSQQKSGKTTSRLSARYNEMLLKGPYASVSTKITPKTILHPVSADQSAGIDWPNTSIRPLTASPTLQFRIAHVAHQNKAALQV